MRRKCEKELKEKLEWRDGLVQKLTDEIKELKRFKLSVEIPSKFKLGDCVRVSGWSAKSHEGNPYKVIEAVFYVEYISETDLYIKDMGWKYTIINKDYSKLIAAEQYLTLNKEETNT